MLEEFKQRNYFYKYINTDLIEIKCFYIKLAHCINNCFKKFYSFVFVYFFLLLYLIKKIVL